MTATIAERVERAHNAGTPLLAIETADPRATISAIAERINGDTPHVVWDICNGLHGHNEPGIEAVSVAKPSNEFGDDDETCDPTVMVKVVTQLPAESIVYMKLAGSFLGDPAVVQGIANLRDLFKSDGRVFILLDKSLQLPAALEGDTVKLDEPLPDHDDLAQIVRDLHEDASLELPEDVTPMVVALQGVPSIFRAEQSAAMSLTKTGMDLDELWDRKRQQIEATPGLQCYKGSDGFDGIGGCAAVLDFLGRLVGNFDACIWLDEFEKSMAGSQHDTSGVSQDQHGKLLAWMQDTDAFGVLFVGHPGCAKSAVAKAFGNEAGIPTICLDLGGLKGSLVGQSEANLRQSLKTIDAVSNGKPIVIATCNKLDSLSPELRRRFGFVFYFELPDMNEKIAIWRIHINGFGLDATQDRPDDTDWTGDEIRRCCKAATLLGVSLVDAAEYITPMAQQSPQSIQALRDLADGSFLSASKPGTFRIDSPTRPAPAAPAKTRRRRIS